jgi:hypothetical protein
VKTGTRKSNTSNEPVPPSGDRPKICSMNFMPYSFGPFSR